MALQVAAWLAQQRNRDAGMDVLAFAGRWR
jgi:hypothetical protein